MIHSSFHTLVFRLISLSRFRLIPFAIAVPGFANHINLLFYKDLTISLKITPIEEISHYDIRYVIMTILVPLWQRI